MSEYICNDPAGWDFYNDGNPRIKLWKTDEEVIRCRECAYFGPDKSDHEYRAPWWCDRWSSDLVALDGYCAWSERRMA